VTAELCGVAIEGDDGRLAVLALADAVEGREDAALDAVAERPADGAAALPALDLPPARVPPRAEKSVATATATMGTAHNKFLTLSPFFMNSATGLCLV
jgi:hypothetical protein